MKEERELAERIEALGRDSRSCAVFVYTELAFHRIIGGDPSALDRIQPHAGFWNAVLAGLQCSAFVALGRIYDKGKGTRSAHHLLKYAETNRGVFSHAMLRQRKRGHGLDETAADEFVKDAFEPRHGAFDDLRKEFERHQAYYVERIEPIRHTVFAHAGAQSLEDRNKLFTGLMVRDLERTVVFPLQLYRALWGLFQNGNRPLLPDALTLTSEVIAAGAPPHTSTWEHQHAAQQVKDLHAWLLTAPAD